MLSPCPSLAACRAQFRAAGRARRCFAAPRAAAEAPRPDAAASAATAAAAVKAQQELVAKALQTPEAQAEVAEMSAFLSNPAVREKLAGLKDDPELAGFMNALKTKGPAALVDFMNDEATLRAFARKLGPVAAPPPPPAAAAARLPPPKPPAEIATLLEAARWTDLEAVEDFLAVGKSVSEADPNGRTPLHLAVAFGSGEDGARVVRLLLESGAPLEAGDDRGNTSLHYAAGYARAEYVSLLLEAGAAAGAQNFLGQTPGQIVRLEPRNPLNANADLLAKLP